MAWPDGVGQHAVTRPAIVLVAPERFALEHRAPVEPTGDLIAVDVTHVGLCGTDLHIVEGVHPRARFPLVLGHEIVGRARGGALDGQLVVIDPLIACGMCVACRLGERHVCAELRLMGIDRDGGLSGRVVVPAERLHPVPVGVEAELAALGEPLAVAVHAVRRAMVSPGMTVAIIGAGPIGLLLAFAARHAGAARILISEPSAGRLAFAAALGFETLDPAGPVEDLAARTDGALADVVFDAAGAPAVAAILPRLVRPAGRISLVGVYGSPVALDLQAVVFRELCVIGNRVYTPADIDAALALLATDEGSGLRQLISAVVPLAETAAAFERLRAGDGIKILVDVGAG